ncbi:MAG: hypothetical protein A2W28_00835 [Gammaproteobacteria bacterium RBG_16_51_14]|nr:MAG: hypothetical protein A2W28_00835 [Gammaproteobacteria bacterium RBG_16_51_14]
MRTAVFGLGIMGRAIAKNLAEDGLLAAAWNRTPQPGFPEFVPLAEEAAGKAGILLVLVRDDQAVADVLAQIEPALTGDHIIVQCSTVRPDSNREFKKRSEGKGVAFVEALIGGSKLAAINRKMIFYTGGDQEVLTRVEPVLSVLSDKRVHVGAVGMASVAKLAMNLNLAIQVQALCESYAYAKSMGLNDDQYFTVLRNNTGWNGLCEVKEPKLRNQEFSPEFTVKNMLKDIRLALQTDCTDRGMALLQKVESIYHEADTAGLGEEDMIALYKQINDI